MDKTKKQSGYVYLYKSMIGWGWKNNPNVLALFVDLLLYANYEDKENGGQIVKRGQLMITLSELAKRTGLTIQQVRTALNKLKLTNEITIETSNKFTVVTIQNYEDYQNSNTRSNKPITNKEQTNNKPITNAYIYKEIKEIKEIEEIKTSKNSRTACSKEELGEIARRLDYPLYKVQLTHDTIMDKITAGEFKDKTVYYTLCNWIRRDIARNGAIGQSKPKFVGLTEFKGGE